MLGEVEGINLAAEDIWPTLTNSVSAETLRAEVFDEDKSVVGSSMGEIFGQI